MRNIIKNGKDFRIIPEKFESSTVCNITDAKEDSIDFTLPIASEAELNDYTAGDEVEIFGSNNEGLIYFVTKIINKSGKNITVNMPESYKNIQRREYSRVDFKGELSFVDYKDVVLQTDDISAGGLKFISSIPLEEHLEYNINIGLSNNLTINCTIQPIRIQQIDYNGKNAYSISGKFKTIESIDRIALVQYSFRSLTEAENLK